MAQPKIAAMLSLLLSTSLAFFCACTGGTSTGAVENSATTTAPATSSTQPATQAGSPSASQPANAQPGAANSANTESRPQPTLAEAQSAVARIYKKSVTVDTAGRSNPFLVGDFNGDGVEDIAVVVRPAKGALADINSEYANWIMEDLTKVQLPVEQNGRQVLPPKPAPVKATENDQLLAVIHGYQKAGWRNDQARQTYLLKNAVGDNMRAQSVRYALAGASTNNPHLSLNGDVIKETLGGQSGYIYWTGAKYAWRQ